MINKLEGAAQQKGTRFTSSLGCAAPAERLRRRPPIRLTTSLRCVPLLALSSCLTRRAHTPGRGASSVRGCAGRVRRAQPRQAGAPRAPRGVFTPRAGRGDVIAWLWVVRCRAPRAAAKTKALMPPPGPHSAPTSFIPQHAHTMTSKGLHARRSTMPRTQAPGQARSFPLPIFVPKPFGGGRADCRGRALHTENLKDLLATLTEALVCVHSPRPAWRREVAYIYTLARRTPVLSPLLAPVTC